MIKEEVIQITKKIVETYFCENDRNILKDYLSSAVSWIGTGETQNGFSYDQTYEKLIADVCETDDRKIKINDERFSALEITGKFCYVEAFLSLEITGSEEKSHIHQLRLTILYQKEEDGFKILRMHSSVPIQKEAENSVIDGTEAKIVSMVRQISSRESADLKHAKEQDPLTGIYNMEGFVEHAKTIIENHPDTSYALLKMGVRQLRNINKTFGYTTGDQILINIAKDLSKQLAEGEICGRIEKDNFAVLVVYRGAECMRERIKDLHKNLVSEDRFGHIREGISFSTGIYLMGTGNDEEIKVALDKALLAQQRASREKWKNNFVYYEEKMENDVAEKQALMERAERAMKQHDFKLYIQPQVDIMTGKAVAGEALARWIDQSGIVMMPGDFIPVFEETGFICQFDFYMLEVLCGYIRRWLDEGLEVLPVSINQSRLHLEESDYVDEFCSIVDKWQVPHQYLAFELTESAFIQHNEQVLGLAQRLHEEGFLLYIDDFGTGYASLNMLSLISADVLKVDKSLLDECKGKRGVVVLKKVIEMARDTQMMTIVEGIETKGQWEMLKRLGSDMGQGYYFYRPVPAEEFEKIIKIPSFVYEPDCI